MDDINRKVKQWVNAMTSEQLDGLAAEMEENLGTDITSAKNKALFKLILYLSHTASKCDKSKITTGLEIWRISCCICSKLKEIPDLKKFLSTIFHITSCLLDMGLYEEAMEVCNYVLLGKLWENVVEDCSDMYSKVSSLWRNTAQKLLKNLRPWTQEIYTIFVAMVKFELDLIRLTCDKYSCRILSKILSHCEKIRCTSNSYVKVYERAFKNSMLAYISTSKISLDDENKYQTYRFMLLLINEMIVCKINKSNIESIAHTLGRCFDAFRSSLQAPNEGFYPHESCLACFKLYEKLCTTLLRPIENLALDIKGTTDGIDVCTKTLVEILQVYGYKHSVKWYSYAIVLVLNPLLSYWEENVKSYKDTYLTNDLLVSMMKLVDEQSNIFCRYENTDCRCGSKTCEVEYDVYNSVALRLRVLSVVSQYLLSKSSAENTVNEAFEFTEEGISLIYSLKLANCSQLYVLWPAFGAHIYNIGICCETTYYEYSVKFYCLLCSSIVRFEGIKAKTTYLNLRDPVSTTLYRLSSSHFRNEKYEEAAIVCSLNGLLSHENSESKAYRMWLNIKYKYPAAKEITMLDYLRSNKKEIDNIIKVDLKAYDLHDVCLREIKGLQEARVNLSSSIIAVLNEMERLNAPPELYAQGVQLLGYHLLNFQHEQSISRFIRKATIKYEHNTKPSKKFRWFYAHLQFYIFIERLRYFASKTESEMKSAEIERTTETNTNEHSAPPKSDNVIPTYSTVNLTVSAELSGLLQQALLKWKEIITCNLKNTIKDWEIAQTLHTIKIAAEYARLHHYQTLEAQAWNLAFELACEMEDHRSIIYITSQSLCTQLTNIKWIEEANKSILTFEKPYNPDVRKIITTYRLYLSNFYFRNGQRDEAKKLFIEATTNPTIGFQSDLTNYLLHLDIAMYNCLGEAECDDQLKYSRAIVLSLYTMISMDDAVNVISWGEKEHQLLDCIVLFDVTNRLALRMNSLLSYREISAHLKQRLKTAQKLGAAMRVAECLKSLCYIDLSRAQLDDCEVKLQGLEHILEIEAFDLSMKSKLSSNPSNGYFLSTSPSQLVEAVRDVRQSDASPILRKKVFATPDFMLHGSNCKCFKCRNVQYRYLVFACTHIRAQLYALQRNNAAALQHFHGALKIMNNILSQQATPSKDATADEKDLTNINMYHQHEMVEYAIFHLDFSRFLKWSSPLYHADGLQVALDALELCETYNLKNHPVYISAKELIFEYRFENIFSNPTNYSKFTVPDIDDMDISHFDHTPAQDPVICVTPVREILPQTAISVRRKKTPPFLKLNKVPIDLTDNEPAISTLTPSRRRPIRRRIAEQEYIDSERTVEKKSLLPRMKLTMVEDQTPSAKTAGSCVKNNVEDSNSSNKDASDKLQTVSKKIDKLVESIDVLTISSETDVSTKRTTRSKSQQGSASSSRSSSTEGSTKTRKKDVEVTPLLNKLAISKQEAPSVTLSERSTKPPRTSRTNNFGKLKRSASASSDKDTILVLDSADSSEDEATMNIRRTSSRLRNKSEDLSIRKGSSSRLLDTGIGSVSNSEDEVFVESHSHNNYTKRATSSTKQPTVANEVTKPTRNRLTKKST